MSSETIGIRPDDSDTQPELSRIKIESRDQISTDEQLLKQALQESIQSITNIRHSRITENTAYFIVESAPLNIDLQEVDEEISQRLSLPVSEVWVRRVFYDELDELLQEWTE